MGSTIPEDDGPKHGATTDEPLQLIEFVRNQEEEVGATTTIKLKYETIDRVFHQIGDLPISVICVCGPSRQGKSFLLGYMIRCLEGLETDTEDWMGWDDKKRPLKGFKFRNGTSPETKGIWIWSRPFIVKNEDDKKVAVILLDTQGTYDEFTTSKDMSAIVGLSLLSSSVMIFNFFNNLQEDTLTALKTYIDYGSLALEKGQNSGTPFQKLSFLIRDWNNPGECPYGAKGGKLFLKEKLTLKEGQPVESKHVRETIKKCFKELDCYLMPSIGEKAKFPEFKGSIDELAPKFAKDLETFISNLISTETLTMKEILGEQVTASELKSCLETYIDVFNSDDVPTAETMWQATLQMSCNNAVEKAMKKYHDFLKKRLRGNSYVQDEDLSKAHSTGEKQALELFRIAKTMGNPEMSLEFEEKLEKKIKAAFAEFKKQNDEKRSKFVGGATNDATSAFRAQLEEDFPFEDNADTDFYEEAKIKRSSGQAQSSILEDFKEKLSSEGEDKLKVLIQSLEDIFETIFDSISNKNKANKANAERVMIKLVEELGASHHSKFQEYLESYKFEEDEATLQNSHGLILSSTVESFKNFEKPGKKDFHKEYLTKLEAEMEANFAHLKNIHKLHIQDSLLKMETVIKEITADYETKLRAAAEGDDDMDEDELQEIHSKKSSFLIENLPELNPFPQNSPIHAKFETRVKEELQEICSKIQSELLENNHRSLESYQKAAAHALHYYKEEMKVIMESDEFMTVEDLEVEHARLHELAMEEYENFPKIGVISNALNMKYDLKDTTLMEEWGRLQSECRNRRELALSKSKNCLSECEAEYQKLMKDLDKVRTLEELQQSHEKSREAVLEQLQRTCPMRDPTILNGYVEQLRESVEEIFEELQEVWELRRTEEETATKGLLVDARKGYHEEMEKHCRNDQFMKPAHLEAIHKQVKDMVMNKCEKRTPLSTFQKDDLEKAMDDLLEKYMQKNDMYLNSSDMCGAPAIGIDLGTTYCCVAVFSKGKVHIIPNHDQGGNLTTASYVAFNPDGSESYGGVAKDNAYKNPENTIYDAKRIIGRKMADKELQEDIKFWPFGVQEDDGVPKIMVNGIPLHPEQISGKLLAQLRGMAEKHLKLDPGTITTAVITVPAYFNDGQRQATLDAGELAGFEKVDLTIMSEPTAAAMAYSMDRMDTNPNKILIYDLGGGTFDIAILDMTTPKKIEVLGVNGDTHLGGEDFDKRMMEHCALVFKNECGIDLFDGKDSSVRKERDEARRRLRRLQTYCEKAKRELASARTAQVSVDAIMDGLDLTVDVTREKFEELNMAYFEKTIRLVEEELRNVGLRKEEIDDVVLVGGSSRIPKVQEMLSAFFNGKALNKSIHPDHAVAHGAAVQAALLNGEQAKGQIDFDKIEDVTPMSLGIENALKELSVILPKNSKIPTRRKEVFCTFKDNQTSAHIQVYQGEDFDIAANNNKLGDFVLEGIPPKPKQKEKVDVWMEIDSMGILHVEAVCLSNKGRNTITVEANKHRMSRETIRQIRDSEAEPA